MESSSRISTAPQSSSSYTSFPSLLPQTSESNHSILLNASESDQNEIEPEIPCYRTVCAMIMVVAAMGSLVPITIFCTDKKCEFGASLILGTMTLATSIGLDPVKKSPTRITQIALGTLVATLMGVAACEADNMKLKMFCFIAGFMGGPIISNIAPKAIYPRESSCFGRLYSDFCKPLMPNCSYCPC